MWEMLARRKPVIAMEQWAIVYLTVQGRLRLSFQATHNYLEEKRDEAGLSIMEQG